MSDYMQLGFYCEDHRMKKKDGSEYGIGGYNTRSSDGLNYIMLNLHFIGKRMMDTLMSKAFECKDVTVSIGGKEVGTANVTIHPLLGDELAFDMFLDWFLECWWHEYLHMVGFEEEQVHFITKTDVHVIEIDVEDDE